MHARFIYKQGWLLPGGLLAGVPFLAGGRGSSHDLPVGLKLQLATWTPGIYLTCPREAAKANPA